MIIKISIELALPGGYKSRVTVDGVEQPGLTGWGRNQLEAAGSAMWNLKQAKLTGIEHYIDVEF